MKQSDAMAFALLIGGGLLAWQVSKGINSAIVSVGEGVESSLKGAGSALSSAGAGVQAFGEGAGSGISSIGSGIGYGVGSLGAGIGSGIELIGGGVYEIGKGGGYALSGANAQDLLQTLLTGGQGEASTFSSGNKYYTDPQGNTFYDGQVIYSVESAKLKTETPTDYAQNQTSVDTANNQTNSGQQEKKSGNILTDIFSSIGNAITGNAVKDTSSSSGSSSSSVKTTGSSALKNSIYGGAIAKVESTPTPAPTSTSKDNVVVSALKSAGNFLKKSIFIF